MNDKLVVIDFPRGMLLGWNTGFLEGKRAVSLTSELQQ